MENEVWNIFSYNKFFEKSIIFQENDEKKFLEHVTIFNTQGYFMPKLNKTFFMGNEALNNFFI